MGIYDRDYVRRGRSSGAPMGYGGPGAGVGFGAPSPLSVTAWLILINTAVFVVQMFLPDHVHMLGAPGREPVRLPGDTLFQLGYFSTYEFLRLEVWRLITFQFLHGSFTHLLFNMIGLWIFGKDVEAHLGRRNYLAFYLICGLAGGVLYMLLNLLGDLMGLQFLGLLVHDYRLPLIGASAGVFGVIMGAAYLRPNSMIYVFGLVPLTIRLFAFLYVGFALLNLLAGSANAGGEAAHLGGAVAGWFFVQRIHLLRDFFDVFGDSRKDTSSRRAHAGPSDAEVDRVLAKVREGGLSSLSDSEKRVLQRASAQRRSA